MTRSLKLVFKFFDKKSFGVVTHVDKFAIKREIMTNQRTSNLACSAKVSKQMRQLAEQLQKPVIRKFE